MPLAKIEIEYAAGAGATVRAIAAALPSASVVHLRPRDSAPSAPKAFWEAVADGLGRVDARHQDSLTHRPFESNWWDIRYDPEQAGVYRHSATAQPLHTDNAFHADPPNGALFFCERPAARGGETIFVDGEALCAALRADDPALYDELKHVPVGFSRGDVPGQTVAVIGERGGRPVLNWNYYRVTPGQGPRVEALRTRFFDYLARRFENAPESIRVGLAAGDGLVFKEQRVIHGRTAFEGDPAHPRTIQTMNLHLPATLD